MKIEAIHPDMTGNEQSYLTATAQKDQAVIYVANGSGMAANDMLCIGLPKDEKSEIKRILSVSGNTVTLTSNLSQTHSSNTKVQIIDYDQVKFYKSTTISGTYDYQATKSIAIGNEATLYEDSSALSTDYFKLRYYNSYSGALSPYSDPISSAGFARYALATIVDAVYRRAGDLKKQWLTRDEIVDWANEVKDDMENKLVENNEKLLLQKTTLTGFSTDSEYESDLPARFRKVQHVIVSYDGVDEDEAMKMRVEDIDDNYSYSQDDPRWYFNNFRLGTRPKITSSSGYIKLRYEGGSADMDDDSDELAKPMRFYMKVFMDGMMVRVCEKDKRFNDASAYERKYQAGCEEMIEQQNNLVLNELDSVDDTEEGQLNE